MDLKDPKQLTEMAFRLLPTVEEIGRDGQIDDGTLERVLQRIQRIQAGLAPEIEFVAVVNWLGCCRAISRIDQLPLPQYNDETPVRVPDILAISCKDKRVIPVLIEVKRTSAESLVWSESLRKYAELVGMPLLMAWKRYSIWALNEICHFQKRVTSYHLTWSDALRQNLMSVLFGDELVIMSQRISFFLDAQVHSEHPIPALPA